MPSPTRNCARASASAAAPVSTVAEIGHVIQDVGQPVQDDVGEVIAVEYVIENEVGPVAHPRDQVTQLGPRALQPARITERGNGGSGLGGAVQTDAAFGLQMRKLVRERRGPRGSLESVRCRFGLHGNEVIEIAGSGDLLRGEPDGDALLADQRPQNERDRDREGADHDP